MGRAALRTLRWSSLLVLCTLLSVSVSVLGVTINNEIISREIQNGTTEAPSETQRHKNYEVIRSCLVPHPRIECDAHFSNGASNDEVQVECISSFPNRVLRVVGEYDVLTLNCKAGFNLDFDYNGFQPTEAIKILFWNQIQTPVCEGCVPQTQPKTYHMKVDVYSNKALHKFYLDERIKRAANTSAVGNSTTTAKALVPALAMIKYPRTGLFLVRGMHGDLKKQEFGVYMFLEEPQVEPRLMHNNATKPYEVSTNRIMIPCRPSHYNASVTLYRIHEEKLLPVSNGEFNPREGFNIPVESQRDLVIFQVVPTTFGMTTWRFQCSIGKHRLNMSYPGSDPENLFGFDAIPQIPSRNPQPPVNIEPNPIDLNPVTVNITCVIVTPDPNSRESVVATIDYGNPAEIRLRSEFVLPDYCNKSYSVLTKHVSRANATHELKIFGASMVGTYYCGSGSSYNKIRAYALALNGKIYDLEFDTPYAELQHTSPPPEAHVQLKLLGGDSAVDPYDDNRKTSAQNTKLIAGRQYTFNCRIDTFTMGRTIVWELAYSNRTKRSYIMVYNFEGEFQNYTFEATWDLVHLACSAAYWNLDLWQTDTLTFAIEGEEYISVTGGYMICVVAIFVLLVVIMVLYTKYRAKNQWYFTRSEIREFHKGNPYVSLHNGLHDGGSNLPYDQRYEIDVKNFKLDSERILGQGEFGVVYSGFVGDRPVGIKTVKNRRDKLLVKGLLAELKIQIHLGTHENIVQLVGAYTSQLRQGNVMVFLEFCPLGSLESYLQRNRYYLEGINSIPSPYTRLAFTDPNCNKSDPCPLTVPDLYKWCYQIANGMSYLSEKKVIHADLATRNVLLTADKTAKICDFGFSRRLRNYKIYMLKDGQSTPLPWAWMAPEALLDFAFSVQSDVWSFGVTVWEIFSLGARPYPGLSCGMEFVQRLKNGMRNHKPDLASMELYREVMRECWRYDPTDRPSFTELCLTLDYLLDTHAPSESRNQSLSSSSDSGVSVLHSSESAIATSCSNLNE